MGRNKAAILGANPQLSEDDNVLVRGVEGSPYAIGYFGYAYFEAEKGRLKAIAIDGVAPSKETRSISKYPLARPLFLYSTQKVMKEKPQVSGYINFYLQRVNDAFKRVAYFPAPAAELTTAKQNWINAMK